MTDFDAEVENVIDIFVARNRFGVCLLSSTLLVNRLREGNVIEGYQLFEREKTYIRHYWVRINNQDVDPGTEINQRLQLPHAPIPTRITEEKPGDDYFYASGLNLEELEELENGYRLYQESPKRYWKLITARLGWIRKFIINN